MSVAESAAPGRFDAAALGELLLQPWRDLQRWPLFAWLSPQPAVRLLQADGAESLWVGEQRRVAGERELRAAPFTAVELPAEQVLESRVTLPPAMAAADRDDALALQVRMASPFDPADLVWGARAGHAPGEWVALLASRRAVQGRLEAVSADGRRSGGPPEVWAFDGQGRPVVLRGFGEAARQRRSGRGRGLAAGLLLLALLLGLAAAVTPTVQLKLRAMQAARAEAELQRQLAPVLAQREALAKALSQLDALRELMGERVDPLAVLDLVTQAVPDDSFLQRLQLQGARVTLSGQTPNTAALMNRLSSQPQVRDVKAPAPATRALGGRENFTIEFSLTPEALRPVVGPVPAVAAPASAAASAPAAAAPAASAASATTAASPAFTAGGTRP
ncbi:MAG: PilN domain-containing protein [Rubrivivax sp.]